jgi:hypothetical protein
LGTAFHTSPIARPLRSLTPKLAVIVGGGAESQGAGGGWAWVLSDLKSLLETGSILAS